MYASVVVEVLVLVVVVVVVVVDCIHVSVGLNDETSSPQRLQSNDCQHSTIRHVPVNVSKVIKFTIGTMSGG